MDRFIGWFCVYSWHSYSYLKSNMDRFIAECPIKT